MSCQSSLNMCHFTEMQTMRKSQSKNMSVQEDMCFRRGRTGEILMRDREGTENKISRNSTQQTLNE